MKKLLPHDIYKDVGCSRQQIFLINQGRRQPSDDLAVKIIKAMQERGENISLADLRPDLAEVL